MQVFLFALPALLLQAPAPGPDARCDVVLLVTEKLPGDQKERFWWGPGPAPFLPLTEATARTIAARGLQVCHQPGRFPIHTIYQHPNLMRQEATNLASLASAHRVLMGSSYVRSIGKVPFVGDEAAALKLTLELWEVEANCRVASVSLQTYGFGPTTDDALRDALSAVQPDLEWIVFQKSNCFIDTRARAGIRVCVTGLRSIKDLELLRDQVQQRLGITTRIDSVEAGRITLLMTPPRDAGNPSRLGELLAQAGFDGFALQLTGVRADVLLIHFARSGPRH